MKDLNTDLNKDLNKETETVSGKQEIPEQKEKKAAVRDMTVGSPMRQIIAFAFPLLGGLLFQHFYNLVDTMIVGRILGVDALAGVGSTGSIHFLIIGFCMGVSTGFTIPISQQFGAKHYREMRCFFANSILLCAVFAAVMTTLCSVFSEKILLVMRTPENIFGYAHSYILILFFGIPVTYAYNLLSGAIRALGNSRAPVIFLIISSFVNILLDFVLIVYGGMGTEGAAVATVLSQMLSVVMSLIYILRKVPLLHVQKNEWRMKWLYARSLLVMGVPMGLQFSITAIGSVLLQRAVNSLGSVYVAAQTAGGKVGMFFSTPFDALGSTMATYGGQNVGAGKIKRLDEGLKAVCLIGAVYSVAAAIVLFLFGGRLTGLFLTEGAAEVMRYGHLSLRIMSLFYIPLALVNIIRYLIQGMGYSELAMVAGVCEMVGRASAALLLIPKMGYLGACFASPIAWILADAFLITAYIYARNKTARTLGIEVKGG